MQAVQDSPVTSRPVPAVHQRPTPESVVPAASRGYLTFRLGQETYCVDILHVQEIRGYSAPTRIADAPPAVKGALNLRGTIVPVIDLRPVFGIADACYDAVTATVVVIIGGRCAGLIVDAVADVVEIQPEQVNPPPAMEGAGTTGCIAGLATMQVDDRSDLFILLDMQRLFAMPAIGLY